jgi:hypothetical protein
VRLAFSGSAWITTERSDSFRASPVLLRRIDVLATARKMSHTAVIKAAIL